MEHEAAGIESETHRQLSLHLKAPLTDGWVLPVALEGARRHCLIAGLGEKWLGGGFEIGKVDAGENPPLRVVVAWRVEIAQLTLAFVESAARADHRLSMEEPRGPRDAGARLEVLRHGV